jgi:hypothetical protein
MEQARCEGNVSKSCQPEMSATLTIPAAALVPVATGGHLGVQVIVVQHPGSELANTLLKNTRLSTQTQNWQR